MEPMIEHRFRELGIDRATAVGTQSIVIQPLVLAGTRTVAVIPERLGRHFAEQAGVRLLDLPYPLDPLPLAMFWTPRADHDPAHRWLRERVLQAAAALGWPPRRKPALIPRSRSRPSRGPGRPGRRPSPAAAPVTSPDPASPRSRPARRRRTAAHLGHARPPCGA